MASLDNLRTLVQREVMDCPNFLIDTALNKAARAFLKETGLWRQTVDLQLTLDGGAIYALAPPSDTALCRIEWVKINDDSCAIANSGSELRTSGARNKPCAFEAMQSQQIAFYPAPDQSYTAHINMVLRPIIGSKEVPSYVLDEGGEGIAFLAAAELRGAPGYEWSNAGESDRLRKRGEDIQIDVRIEVETRYVVANKTMMSPFGWK